MAMAGRSFRLGSALVVAGESWLINLLAAPLLGAGFGGRAMSFNTLFGTHFSQKNAGLLNVLNATYGLGAVAAPWLVSKGIYSGEEIFIAIAVLSCVVMLGAWGVDDRVSSTLPQTQTTDRRAQNVAPLLVPAFFLLFLESGLT